MKQLTPENIRTILDTQLTLAFVISKMSGIPSFYRAMVKCFTERTEEDLSITTNQRDIYIFMIHKGFESIDETLDPEDAKDIVDVKEVQKMSSFKKFFKKHRFKKELKTLLDVAMDNYKWNNLYLTYGGSQEGYRDLINLMRIKFLEIANVEPGDLSWMNKDHTSLLGRPFLRTQQT